MSITTADGMGTEQSDAVVPYSPEQRMSGGISTQTAFAVSHARRVSAFTMVVIAHAVVGWLLLQQRQRAVPMQPQLTTVFIAQTAEPVEEHVMPPSVDLPSTDQPVFAAVPELRVTPNSVAPAVAPIGPEMHENTANPGMVSRVAEPVTRPVLSDIDIDYLQRPTIRYPASAKRMNEQGTALLAVLVDERGQVTDVMVIQSSGSVRLDEAAVRALRLARFRPYVRNGAALAVEVRVPVEFFLAHAV